MSGDGGSIAKLAHSVPEAAELVGVCERTMWALVSSGQVVTVKIGRRRLIRHHDLADFVANLDGAA